MVAMVREGLGLAVLTEDVAADAGLEPVLTDQFRIDIPTWLVTHRELNTNRRIRLVYDAIAEQLRAAKKNGRP
jgi:DNA-binding transcriptional LysR family regulator